jgi:hypothetical protein
VKVDHEFEAPAAQATKPRSSATSAGRGNTITSSTHGCPCTALAARGSTSQAMCAPG